MARKTTVTRSGRVPGSGKEVVEIRDRPDDPTLLTVAQIAKELGVSRPAVVTKALERLRIGPVEIRTGSRSTYDHGGKGHRSWDTPWFSRSVLASVDRELRSKATPTTTGKLSYEGVTFSFG